VPIRLNALAQPPPETQEQPRSRLQPPRRTTSKYVSSAHSPYRVRGPHPDYGMVHRTTEYFKRWRERELGNLARGPENHVVPTRSTNVARAVHFESRAGEVAAPPRCEEDQELSQVVGRYPLSHRETGGYGVFASELSRRLL